MSELAIVSQKNIMRQKMIYTNCRVKMTKGTKLFGTVTGVKSKRAWCFVTWDGSEDAMDVPTRSLTTVEAEVGATGPSKARRLNAGGEEDGVSSSDSSGDDEGADVPPVSGQVRGALLHL